MEAEDGKLKCNCPSGTFGEDCSLGVCEIENPCLNGGTCVPASNIADTPSCICPPGTFQPVCEQCYYNFTRDAYIQLDSQVMLAINSLNQTQCDEECDKDERCTFNFIGLDGCYIFEKPVIFASGNGDLNKYKERCMQMEECLLLTHILEDNKCFLFNVTLNNALSILRLIEGQHGNNIAEKICC
ncbi:hypothetical protein LOTGIDRAFT_162880 [Lottia gigantea]|uniref:EGF-like domain-containing protein n=1 Tax=Lottia gigantea TaxID=225164 RepID=V4AAU5_LOTGI|nr:hypothetical protein LOTGIDRAFT_162880 [Lottia gigantea]ESO92225.1 hypothetical protein LOTGIDRAFT_162880 [Lottia gigantea]